VLTNTEIMSPWIHWVLFLVQFLWNYALWPNACFCLIMCILNKYVINGLCFVDHIEPKPTIMLYACYMTPWWNTTSFKSHLCISTTNNT
jgi:hypothetical protein